MLACSQQLPALTFLTSCKQPFVIETLFLQLASAPDEQRKGQTSCKAQQKARNYCSPLEKEVVLDCKFFELPVFVFFFLCRCSRRMLGPLAASIVRTRELYKLAILLVQDQSMNVAVTGVVPYALSLQL